MEVSLNEHNPVFFSDEVIQFHSQYLRNELMEQNFLKIVEPYSVVEIGFVAKKMDLPVEEVEMKIERIMYRLLENYHK